MRVPHHLWRRGVIIAIHKTKTGVGMKLAKALVALGHITHEMVEYPTSLIDGHYISGWRWTKKRKASTTPRMTKTF